MLSCLNAVVSTNESRALEFITGHVFYNPAYNYKFQLKTTKVNENLRNALNFTANQEETDMIKDYIESFKTGDVNAHKNGSR